MERRTEMESTGLTVPGCVGQTVGSRKLESGSEWLPFSRSESPASTPGLLGSARRGSLLAWAFLTDRTGDSLVAREPKRIAVPSLEMTPSF